MNISELRNYGMAMSDAESLWPKALKKQMARHGRAIVFAHLRGFQVFRFVWAYLKAKRRAKKADLSAIRAKGMTNEEFLKTQINYLSMFSALAEILGTEKAIQISKEIMEKTAREALLLCLPELEKMQGFEDPFEAFREYLKPMPEACHKAGCLQTQIVDRKNVIGFDVSGCVWLDLAKTLGVPEACIPNCHADDLVFPEYFKALGIRYQRTETLACGGTRCDFRFFKSNGVK